MKSKQLTLLIIFLFFSACKQSEFYDKSQLLDNEMGKGVDSPPVVTPPDVTPPVVTPPVVTPPVVTPPVVTPPVVTPPVVTPPVVTPPVVTPPVVTPPVVTPPVVTPPVVTPPVVTPPVVTPPVVTPPVVTPPVVTPPGCKVGDACDLTPVALKPGVVTILLALGDIAQNKLVITEKSAQLIAQNAIKFASPVANPKILVIKDINHNGESPEDTQFIATTLLSAYRTDVLIESSAGLKASQLVGYDVVWFNNPGHAMGFATTLKVLKGFAGGVILSGDDLTQGRGFTTESLTGLKYINNGATVSCKGQTYNYDNNFAHKYQVTMAEKFLKGIDPLLLSFDYGNDIDDSALVAQDSKYEVLAFANGAPGTCTLHRPVIVRYVK